MIKSDYCLDRIISMMTTDFSIVALWIFCMERCAYYESAYPTVESSEHFAEIIKTQAFQ